MKAMLEACLENMGANPEEMKSAADNQEVRNEEGTVDTIGTREDRYGDRHLAVGYLRQPKKRSRAMVCPGRR
jgi:hypothetical protein